MDVIDEPSSDGEIVGTIGKPEIKKILVTDKTPANTDLAAEKAVDRIRAKSKVASVPYERWVLEQLVTKGHTTISKETVKTTLQSVHNRAKKLYPDRHNGSSEKEVKRIIVWSDRTGFQLSDPVQSSPLPKPEKPLESFDEEMLDHIANKIVSQEPVITESPITPYPVRDYVLSYNEKSWLPGGDKLESCKVLSCKNLGIKPVILNAKGDLNKNGLLRACCLVEEKNLKDHCPQEKPLTDFEKEIFELIKADTSQETALKSIFKIRAKVTAKKNNQKK